MYGEGAFVNAQPSGSPFKGTNLALAKSGAGQQLDLINIMAYDAGNIQSTGFNASESYMAHRVYWRTQAVALGVQVRGQVMVRAPAKLAILQVGLWHFSSLWLRVGVPAQLLSSPGHTLHLPQPDNGGPQFSMIQAVMRMAFAV